MIITKNGNIEGLPYTAMKKQDGVWLNLLVCRVSLDNADEDLTALFNTDTVEDDAIGVKWDYTQFVKVAADEQYKYVWLTYTSQTAVVDQYEKALNILGVETMEHPEEVGDEVEV
jgi:hypothetical protein